MLILQHIVFFSQQKKNSSKTQILFIIKLEVLDFFIRFYQIFLFCFVLFRFYISIDGCCNGIQLFISTSNFKSSLLKCKKKRRKKEEKKSLIYYTYIKKSREINIIKPRAHSLVRSFARSFVCSLTPPLKNHSFFFFLAVILFHASFKTNLMKTKQREKITIRTQEFWYLAEKNNIYDDSNSNASFRLL